MQQTLFVKNWEEETAEAIAKKVSTFEECVIESFRSCDWFFDLNKDAWFVIENVFISGVEIRKSISEGLEGIEILLNKHGHKAVFDLIKKAWSKVPIYIRIIDSFKRFSDKE